MLIATLPSASTARSVAVPAKADQAADKADIRAPIQEAGLALQPLGQTEIVGVHSRDVSPADKGQTAIQGRDQPAPRREHRSDPGVAASVLRQHVAGGVAGRVRAVVHDDDLEVRHGLGHQRGQGRGQGHPRVVGWQQHRDSGRGHAPDASPSISRMRHTPHTPALVG